MSGGQERLCGLLFSRPGAMVTYRESSGEERKSEARRGVDVSECSMKRKP